MKKLWQKLGIVAFWLSWPFLYIYLRGSERTRVLLTSGDQILVVRSWHGDGRWSLPGGGLHKDEDRVRGALRELKEETNLTLEPGQLKPLTSSMYHDRGLSCMAHYFIGVLPEPIAAQARLPEIIAAEWRDYRTLEPASIGVDVHTALDAWTGRNLVQ